MITLDEKHSTTRRVIKAHPQDDIAGLVKQSHKSEDKFETVLFLPEVAGDAACYFDPYSQESIREAVEKVLNSNELKNELRQKGIKRLEQFSWRQRAIETKKVYESILK